MAMLIGFAVECGTSVETENHDKDAQDRCRYQPQPDQRPYVTFRHVKPVPAAPASC